MKKLLILLILMMPVKLWADLTGTEGLAIDLSSAGAGTDFTIDFDPTELLGSRTWGDASTDTIVWTWNRATGTDPTMTFGNDLFTFGNSLTLVTGKNFILGTTQWDNGSDLMNGEYIADDTIDDDSIDWSDVTFADFDFETNWKMWYSDGSGDVTELTLGANGTFLESNGAAAAPAFRTLVDGDILDNITIDLATLATTLTITDNESTAENNPVVFVAGADPDGGSLGLETDGDFHYNPNTGTVTATEFVGGGSGITGLSVTYENIGNPGASGSISFDDGETATYTGANDGAISFFTIQNSDADHTVGNMYLLDLDYSADDGDAEADFIKFQDNGSVVMTIQQNGDITTDGSLTSSGTVEGATLTEGGNAVWNATEIDIIDSAHYVAGSIDNEHLADDAVDSAEIATDAVGVDALNQTISPTLTGRWTFAGEDAGTDVIGLNVNWAGSDPTNGQSEGDLWYDSTLNVYKGYTTHEIILGSAEEPGIIQAKKGSGGTISAGDAVYISGFDGTDLLVEFADADDSSKMPAIGIASATINSGTAGSVTTFGLLEDIINTGGMSVGDGIWITVTGTTGNTLTNTKPTGATTAIQRIATVASSAASGELFVAGALRTNDESNLTEAYIFVGNSNQNSTAVAMSGDVAIIADGTTAIQTNSVALTTDTTGNYSNGNAEAGDALVSIAVEITDNENTAENNPVVFVAGAAQAGGDLGLESDGTFFYTPSTGTVTATEFIGGGVGLTGVTSSVLYHLIGDPTAAGSISFDAAEGATYTSSDDQWVGVTISNTQADNAGDTELLTLAFTDDGDTNSHYLIMSDAAGTQQLEFIQNGADVQITVTGDLKFIATGGDFDFADDTLTTTGTMAATTFTGALSGNSTTTTTASAGDAAVDFFGAGVDAVTDATTCTDIEGTGLSIGGTTLNWSAASTDLTDTADLLYEAELDDLSELTAQIGDVSTFITDDIMPDAGTDPDVDAMGELSVDTDGGNEPNSVTLRTFMGNDDQAVLADTMKPRQFTITEPDTLAQADFLPIWKNNTGFTFIITAISGESDIDDFDFTIKERDADGANVTTIEAVQLTTDGTAMYYGSVVFADLDHTAIEAGHTLGYDNSADDATYVQVVLEGYFNANVD